MPNASNLANQCSQEERLCGDFCDRGVRRELFEALNPDHSHSPTHIMHGNHFWNSLGIARSWLIRLIMTIPCRNLGTKNHCRRRIKVNHGRIGRLVYRQSVVYSTASVTISSIPEGKSNLSLEMRSALRNLSRKGISHVRSRSYSRMC